MSTTSASRRKWSRRGRYAAVFLPSIAVASVWTALTAQGAVAASIHVSGLPSIISATRLEGTGFQQYGYFDQAYPNSAANPPIPGIIPVARTGIKNATLYNLCQSVTIPGFNVTLVIKAGGGGKPVTAEDLVIDMTKLSGDAEFKAIDIGGSAVDLKKGPTTSQTTDSSLKNMFGQQADSLVITNLKQTAYSTSAGTFTLNGLDLSIQAGEMACPIS